MELTRHTAAVACLVLLAACGGATDAAPELPQTVTPDWSRKSFIAENAGASAAACWKAVYVGGGSASVSLCRYNTEAVAFDAVQRTRAAADTVKFQEGRYFVVVNWSNASQAEVTALVRAIQKTLRAP